MKRHGQGKKIRGHNIQLWPFIAIYVCGVWRLSKSSMPVIYQHIFAIPAIILYNLSSLHLIFFDRAPHLNPFRRELVIKQYHKIAFKGSSIPPEKCLKNAQFPAFCHDKYQNNFRPWPILDISEVGFKHGMTFFRLKPQGHRRCPRPRQAGSWCRGEAVRLSPLRCMK